MKKQLRKDILRARQQLSNDDLVRKSSHIATRTTDLAIFQKAQVVMFYLDFRNEPGTGELISYCLKSNKKVLVPVTDPKMKKLTPSEIMDYPGDLTTGAFGIPEPRKECIRPIEPEQIDLVIVPGVAFDTKGNRLGYGGGFYDRFLGLTKPETVFVALAFELQIVENVYPEAHDLPVHYIVTEERVIKCGENCCGNFPAGS